ncbi:hypothetical protein TRL7639_03057 [Falsiruegeria litorea R37]|uniref:Uncharacterized protein n=1 Tax=Falsiruegeria litorea R37 TaxID=1200284 RepID=A0A1Y5T666_9RHOB|nr:hypothetical protein TRL7639_03057 [Falsiruegeria litorea R37]
MKALRHLAARLRRKLALTPEQVDQMATIKFPCC